MLGSGLDQTYPSPVSSPVSRNLSPRTKDNRARVSNLSPRSFTFDYDTNHPVDDTSNSTTVNNRRSSRFSLINAFSWFSPTLSPRYSNNNNCNEDDDSEASQSLWQQQSQQSFDGVSMSPFTQAVTVSHLYNNNTSRTATMKPSLLFQETKSDGTQNHPPAPAPRQYPSLMVRTDHTMTGSTTAHNTNTIYKRNKNSVILNTTDDGYRHQTSTSLLLGAGVATDNTRHGSTLSSIGNSDSGLRTSTLTAGHGNGTTGESSLLQSVMSTDRRPFSTMTSGRHDYYDKQQHTHRHGHGSPLSSFMTSDDVANSQGMCICGILYYRQ